MLNFSEACERNQAPIWEKLSSLFDRFPVRSVLEVGSGSGQHALFFSQQCPELHWQCSELADNIPALTANLATSGLPVPHTLNILQPQSLPGVDLLYSANTLHIMAEEGVQAFFRAAEGWVNEGGLLVVYGPFRYQGEYTSASNAEFDRFLKTRDDASGIRAFEWVNQLAAEAGFRLLEDYALPANNQLLVWARVSGDT